MARAAACAAAGIIALILVLSAAIGGSVASTLPSGDAAPSEEALADIPPSYLTLYQQAATVCPGLDWAILAAIGKIESDHGRSHLPGVAPGTENAAGAAGSMQFLQPTFDSVVARHEIPPGGETPPSRFNPHDAIHAAAFYLCGLGAEEGDINSALWSYNQSHQYREDVLAQAERYRAAPTAGNSGEPGALNNFWEPEAATVTDPTSGGLVTPRTRALALALINNGMADGQIVCHAQRPSNPASDHPRGKACDVFFNPYDPADVQRGWDVAHWLITNQAKYGVHYLIWQGKLWSASDPSWQTYQSSWYYCPNRSNIIGCHYNHIHASVF